MAFLAPPEDLVDTEAPVVPSGSGFSAPVEDIESTTEALANDDTFNPFEFSVGKDKNHPDVDLARRAYVKKAQQPMSWSKVGRMAGGIATGIPAGVASTVRGAAGAVADIADANFSDDEATRERAITELTAGEQLGEEQFGGFFDLLAGKPGRYLASKIAGDDPEERLSQEFYLKKEREDRMAKLRAGKPQNTGLLQVAANIGGTLAVNDQNVGVGDVVKTNEQLKKEYGVEVDQKIIDDIGEAIDFTEIVPLLGPVQNLTRRITGKATGYGLKWGGKLMEAPAELTEALLKRTRAGRILAGGAGAVGVYEGVQHPQEAITIAAALLGAKLAQKAGRVVRESGEELISPETFTGATAKRGALAQIKKRIEQPGVTTNVATNRTANQAALERMGRQTIQQGVLGGLGMALPASQADSPEEAGALIGGTVGFAGLTGPLSIKNIVGQPEEFTRAATSILAEDGAGIRYENGLDDKSAAASKAAGSAAARLYNAYKGWFNNIAGTSGNKVQVIPLTGVDYLAELLKRDPNIDQEKALLSPGNYDEATGRMLINTSAAGNGTEALGHESGHAVVDNLLPTISKAYGDGLKRAAWKGLLDANGRPTQALKDFISAYNKKTPGAPISADLDGKSILQNPAIAEYISETARAVMNSEPGVFVMPKGMTQDLADRITDGMKGFFSEQFGVREEKFDRADLPELNRAVRDTLYAIGGVVAGGLEGVTPAAPQPRRTSSTPVTEVRSNVSPEPSPNATAPLAQPPVTQNQPARDPFEQRVTQAGFNPESVDVARDTHVGDLNQLSTKRANTKKGIKGKNIDTQVAEKEAEWDAMFSDYLDSIEQSGAAPPQDPLILHQAVLQHALTITGAPANIPVAGPLAQISSPEPPSQSNEAPEPSTAPLTALERPNEPTQSDPTALQGRVSVTEDAPLAKITEGDDAGAEAEQTDQVEEVRALHKSGPIREAIDALDANKGKVVWVKDYESAPKTTSGFEESARGEDIRAQSATKRKKGDKGELQDKPFIPVAIKLNAKNEPYVTGFDVDVMLSNLRHVMDAMQEQKIPHPLKTDQAVQDALETYHWNHTHGYDGAGLKRLKQPGPDYQMPLADIDAQPRPLHSDPKMARRISDMLNMAVNSKAGEIGVGEGMKALALAEENQGFRQGSETNQLRRDLQAAGFDVDKNLSKRSAFYGRLAADLIRGGVSTTPEGVTGRSVRPHGFDIDLQKAFQHGKPQFEAVAGGFMPGDTKSALRSKRSDDFGEKLRTGGPLADLATPRILNADRIVANSSEMREAIKKGLRESQAVHERLHADARAQRDAELEAALKQPVSENTRVVVISAAGPSSGKSTAAAQFQDPALIYDTNLREAPKAQKIIDTIVGSGRMAIIQYIHRPFEDAVRSNITRSYDEGRLVDADNISNGHHDARETIEKLLESNQGRDGVVFDLRFNEGPGGTFRKITPEELRQLPKPSVDILRQRAHRAVDESGDEATREARDIFRGARDDRAADAGVERADRGGENEGRDTPRAAEDKGSRAVGAISPKFMPGGPLADLGKEPDKLGFYSQLERVISDKVRGKVTGDQLRSTLKNNGVKDEEMQWVLGDLIDRKKSEVITPEELKMEVEANRMELQEVVKDDENRDLNDSPSELNTKFSQYQLPGGKNYRELLFTLPNLRTAENTRKVRELQERKEKLRKEYQELNNASERKQPEHGQRMKELSAAMQQIGSESVQYERPATFKSVHFDEPNVILHARVNDRTTVDGESMLFAEELQSDLHQKGRKEGYGDKKTAEQTKRDAIQRLIDGGMTPEDAERFGETNTAQQLEQDKQPVPDAPFKGEAWKRLGIKRLIAKAIQEGKDRIGWTTGEQQAERYDLSKQVGAISARKNTDGTFDVSAVPLKSNGEISTNPSDIIRQTVQESKLAETIGKELAEKIVGQAGGEFKTYQGLDLKVGGEGMKGFYDKELVNIANDLGKKYGARVEKVNIENPDDIDYESFQDFLTRTGVDYNRVMAPGSEQALRESYWKEKQPIKTPGLNVWSLPITPKMREAVQGSGQAKFMPGEESTDKPLSKISTSTETKMQFPEEAGTSNLTAPIKKTISDALMMSQNDPAKARDFLQKMVDRSALDPEKTAPIRSAIDELGKRIDGKPVGPLSNFMPGDPEKKGVAVAMAINPGYGRNLNPGLSYEQSQEITNRVMSAVAPNGKLKMLEKIGIKHELEPTVGQFEGKQEPSFMLRLPDSDFETAKMLAPILGDALLQDAVIPVEYTPDGSQFGVVMEHSSGISPEAVNRFRKWAGDSGQDFTLWSDSSRIVLFDGKMFSADSYTAEDAKAYAETLQPIATELGLDLVIFRQNSEYQSHEQYAESIQANQDGSEKSSDLLDASERYLYEPAREAFEGYFKEIGFSADQGLWRSSPKHQVKPKESVIERGGEDVTVRRDPAGKFMPGPARPMDASEKKDLSFRIGTRKPWTKKVSEEDPATLTVGLEPILAHRDFAEKVSDTVKSYDYLPKVKSSSPQRVLEAFVEHAKENIIWLHDAFPKDLRDTSKLWYDGARKITERWAKEYGHPRQAIAAAIAALSPQKDWFMNVSLAQRLIDVVTNHQGDTIDSKMMEVVERRKSVNGLQRLAKLMQGKKFQNLTTAQKAIWVRLYDEAHNSREFPIIAPDGTFMEMQTDKTGKIKTLDWSSFNPIGKGVAVLEDPSLETIHAAMGDAHKVRNFYNNILLPNSEFRDVTIDTHAVAAALLIPLGGTSPEVLHNFGSGGGRVGHAETGSKGLYGLYAEAYRRAAEARNLLPREIQSITWEAVRGLFSDRGMKKPKKQTLVKDIWRQYAQGKISADDARNQIFEFAGWIEPPDWAGLRLGSTEATRGKADTGALSGIGLPRGGARATERGGGKPLAGVSAAEK